MVAFHCYCPGDQPQCLVAPGSCSASLDANDVYFARRGLSEGGQDHRCEWREHGKCISRRASDDDPETPPAQILLEPEILVHSHERIILGVGGIEQRRIVQIGPATLMHRLHTVTGQQCGEGPWQIPIEQNAHDGGLRCRGDESAFRELEDGDRVVPADVRKRIQELVERMACLEVINEALNRNPSARKYRRAPEALGGSGNQGRG